MVAGHAERVAGGDHPHDEAQHARGVRAAVDEVAHENGASAFGMAGADRPALDVALDDETKVGEQRLELGATAMHVADNVERSGLVPPVVVEAGPDDRRRVDLVRRLENVYDAEALALQPAQPAAQHVTLPAQHVWAEVAVRARGVALGADPLREVEHDGDREHVVLPGERDQVLARLGLHVGGVDDGQAPGREALTGDVVQHVEGVTAGALVVHVVGDEAAAEVAADDLGGPEVARREGAFAGAAHPDE